MSFLLSLLTVCLLSSSDVSASVPADNQSSYQTAFLYFLPDYEPKEVDKVEARGCTKLGYTYTRSNCASPRILKDKCPVGNYYKECYCAGSPTCTGSLSSSTPYPSSTGASKTSCVDCQGNMLYTWICSGCSAYTLSSCPENGFCTLCCNGKYKLDSCDKDYHIEGSGTSAICAKDETCFGETSENTDLGYSCTSCTNLNGTRLYSCSCTGACSLSSCPAHGSCSTDCNGLKCLTGCDNGYSKSGNACILDCVSSCSLDTCPAHGDCTKDCAGKYCLNSCSDGYTLSGNSCEYLDPATNCTTASTLKYLYSDKTTSTELDSSKTAIGIVVDELNRLAAALDAETLAWGGADIDIPDLNNIASIYAGTWEGASGRCNWWNKDQDGKSNTQKILNYGKNNGISYPAAEYANSYQPNGCSSGSWCGAGNWFLPSNYELYPMFNEKEKLREIILNLGGTTTDMHGNGDFWCKSSNEFTAEGNGYLYINKGAAGRDLKTFEGQVRPFIKY